MTIKKTGSKDTGTDAGPDDEQQDVTEEQGHDDGTDGGDDDDFGDLLADEEDEGDGDEGDDDDEDAPLTASAVAKIVESALDRRINDRLAGRLTGRETRGRSRQAQQGKGRQQSRTQQTATGVTHTDLREARSGYREAIADEVKFLSADERKAASRIAEGMISERLTGDDDPYDVGLDVAADVAEEVKALRQMYQSATVSSLRRKGVLPERAGQPTRGSKTTAKSSWSAGAERAKQVRPDRFKNKD